MHATNRKDGPRTGWRWALALGIAACGGDGSGADTGTPAFTPPTGADPAPDVRLSFVDITAAAGIEFAHETGARGDKWMPETMGSGGGFLDYDGDGRPDVFLVNGRRWPDDPEPSPTSRLYRNLGDGRFSDVTRQAGLDFVTYGMGVAFADYDADGDQDIYLTALGDNKLLRNDGGRFHDVTREAGVTGNTAGAPPAWSTGAAWVDVDRDGWLDLFVCNYVRWTPETDLFTTLDGTNKSYATPQQYQGESCRLYRNEAGGRFTDATESAGLFNPEGKSLGVSVVDFNDDGWPDIFVTNDTYQNFLYMNRGDGSFDDAALTAGVALDETGRARAGMGVDVADLTGDGAWSVVIGNFSREPLSLFTQVGSGDLFQDRAGRARLTRSTLLPLTFGVTFADLDLDGRPDLLVGNGHIEPDINVVQRDITFEQTPQLFWNAGDGRFVDISDRAGPAFAVATVARGVATADIDADGDLDVLITVNGGAPKLLRNDLGTFSSIRVRLAGRSPNRGALGAVVSVFAGSTRQRRTVATGSSYLSQSDLGTLIFGLAGAERADSVIVRWPTDGRVSRFGPLAAGGTYVLDEETDDLRTVTEPAG